MTTPILPPLEEPFQTRPRPADGYPGGLHCPLLAAPHRGSRLAEALTSEQVAADRLAIITAPARMDPNDSRYYDDGEGR